MSSESDSFGAAQPSTSGQCGSSHDWTLCILCQTNTGESLQCPARTLRKKVGAGYAYVANNLLMFQELGTVPFDINIEELNAGSGIEANFRENSAKWHKSCRAKIDSRNLQRARKRKQEDLTESSPVKTRKYSDPELNKNIMDVCLFCDEVAGSSRLHKASTFTIDFKVRKCATKLMDSKLLSKLAAGDMVAIDAQYHRDCLSNLYRKAGLSEREEGTSTTDDSLHGIAFAELVSYIQGYPDSRAVFNMSDLKRLYASRLEELGLKEVNVHSTRLKNRILAAIPSIKAYNEGKEVLLAFDKDVGSALKELISQDFDSDALVLGKTAKIIRRDIFKIKQEFQGKFPEGCQENSVPSSLNALISMILDGPDITSQSEAGKDPSNASQAISQLVVYNSVKSRTLNVKSNVIRHNQDQETPLPIYLALKIHGETRKRGLIDALYGIGLCISYDRMLSISATAANRVCALYKEEGLVCPPKLSKHVFTTAAVDNVDHNPSSTTAKDSFHGTSISLMQHPTIGNDGEKRDVLPPDIQKGKLIASLPKSYTNVPPAALTRLNHLVPETTGHLLPEWRDKDAVLGPQYKWLEHAKQLLGQADLDEDNFISWAAYHASLQAPIVDPPATIALMPLFLENAHSVAMIKHSMNVVKEAVQHLNPGQVSVIAMDQPLFAIAKTIQWDFPYTHGEEQFVIMFGGLHIEMAAFKTLGDWLEGSGWTSAICDAGIASTGVADSMIKASHLTRTRHAHQITAASLYILMHQAYDAYMEQVSEEEEPKDFKNWYRQMLKEQPQFQYWAHVLELELCILQLVGSIRQGNFNAYTESLVHLLPWMFSLNHINYARWLSVHVRDMLTLEDKHPALYQEFCSGGFAVKKTNRPFSAIALDHAHEQNNALVKGDGGAVGLTDNPSALRRWMVAGPELSTMIQEFEKHKGKTSIKHHDQNPGIQASCFTEISSLVNVIEEMGNPFMEDSGDLLTLDTKDIMEEPVVSSVRNVVNLGQTQYSLFVQERFLERSKPINEPIKKNKLQLFSSPKTQVKKKTQTAALKDDCALFSRLFIACQSREGNLEDFFRHENQPAPPSLSKAGEMRSGNKADLLSQLETLAQPPDSTPQVTAVLLDGAMVIQMLKPGISKTFEDYIIQVFMPYI